MIDRSFARVLVSRMGAARQARSVWRFAVAVGIDALLLTRTPARRAASTPRRHFTQRNSIIHNSDDVMAARTKAQEMMEKKQAEATLDMGAKLVKRDQVLKWESQARERWAAAKVFETNSPTTEDPTLATQLSPAEVHTKHPKFFGTFPYAYMNGSLHLGHAFTISKVEFAVGFERMLGKRVLFPVAWHATGMPIKASSDKLIREMERFGTELENYKEEAEAEDTSAPGQILDAVPTGDPVDKSKAKKGKIQAKSTGLQYQFQIMESIGVTKQEIKKFADPHYWLDYFPPIAKADLTAFGARVDWRRSFITTDANPYYDSFVRWQMNRLHQKGYIKFGERYTIYSPKDGQPCMDHDRQTGERMGPQEYVALKMRVLEWGPHAAEIKSALQDKEVYLVAATLRPETMYGQTNCFVGPTIKYVVVEVKNGVHYLCTERAARNMAFQNMTSERGVYKKVAEVMGSSLIGTKINAPNCVYQSVHLLPMESILATKGTGVVTSVPSDSPDDYINLMTLRKKAAYFKLEPHWLEFDPISVLSTEEFGDMCAPKLCELLKIESPKDSIKLAEAKERAYKVGFYQGTMTIGSCKGKPVEKAKIKIREELISTGDAFVYSEPEGMITSRSGDECVVALCDQWYLDYGESKWQAQAYKLLNRMNIRDHPTKKKFEEDLDWLHQWACARSYGLGSKLPWDPQFLVESLSDSTVYMAYYTVAHLLHQGDYYGRSPGPLGITPDQLTDEVWDYVFGIDSISFPDSDNTSLKLEQADAMRREFRYFYPMDLRSSGKDLISNHLIFCIYVHTALFDEQFWPRLFRTNGHLLLNGKKMSKSTGNSLTMRDSLLKFGADATRMTLADAGDGFDDANFEELGANANILRMHTFADWAKGIVEDDAWKKMRGGEYTLFDKIFAAEVDAAIVKTREAYEQSMFKEALKYGWFELIGLRDAYRDFTAQAGGMHGELLHHYTRIQSLLVTPIAPHFADHLWTDILHSQDSIQTVSFPQPLEPINHGMIAASEYVKSTIRMVRITELNLTKRKGKGKCTTTNFDVTKPKRCRIFVSKHFPQWQSTCVESLRKCLNQVTMQVDEKLLRIELERVGLFKDRKTMPFVNTLKARLVQDGSSALDRNLLFDEMEILTLSKDYCTRTLGYESVDIEDASVGLRKCKDGESEGYNVNIIEAAEPGTPAFVVYNS